MVPYLWDQFHGKRYNGLFGCVWRFLRLRTITMGSSGFLVAERGRDQHQSPRRRVLYDEKAKSRPDFVLRDRALLCSPGAAAPLYRRHRDLGSGKERTVGAHKFVTPPEFTALTALLRVALHATTRSYPNTSNRSKMLIPPNVIRPTGYRAPLGTPTRRRGA